MDDGSDLEALAAISHFVAWFKCEFHWSEFLPRCN